LGGLEFCLGGKIPPKPPVATGLVECQFVQTHFWVPVVAVTQASNSALQYETRKREMVPSGD